MSNFYCFGLPEYSPNFVQIDINDAESIGEFIAASLIEAVNNGTLGHSTQTCIVQCYRCNMQVKERQEKTKQALNDKKKL